MINCTVIIYCVIEALKDPQITHILTQQLNIGLHISPSYSSTFITSNVSSSNMEKSILKRLKRRYFGFKERQVKRYTYMIKNALVRRIIQTVSLNQHHTYWICIKQSLYIRSNMIIHKRFVIDKRENDIMRYLYIVDLTLQQNKNMSQRVSNNSSDLIVYIYFIRIKYFNELYFFRSSNDSSSQI